MISIQNLVAIQGCDFNSQPWDNGDNQVLTRVATRVAIRVSILTLNRNPETYSFGFFFKSQPWPFMVSTMVSVSIKTLKVFPGVM